jgi:hypothetical protein
MQNNNIGIFLNNTNSEVSLQINLHNYNILKNNFEKIIIIDIKNSFSLKLQDLISSEKNNINIYITDDNCIKNNLSDINIYSVFFLINIIDKQLLQKYINIRSNDINDVLKCNYLTFISDNYIYCDNLSDYFNYINKHNLDFYSYTDSSEKKYHYQLYFFSISYKALNIFKEFILNNKDNIDIEFDLIKLFDDKMPFIKIAYLNENISNNIFYNYKLFKILFNNKLLPIININYLYHFINNFNIIIHTTIPDIFDIEIYRKYPDLEDKSDIFLQNHFLLNGQFENRNYSEDGNCMLPTFIRNSLKSFNLLYFFDIPDNFNKSIYKKNNSDINSLTDKELYLHWINYGRSENRIYY